MNRCIAWPMICGHEISRIVGLHWAQGSSSSEDPTARLMTCGIDFRHHSERVAIKAHHRDIAHPKLGASEIRSPRVQRGPQGCTLGRSRRSRALWCPCSYASMTSSRSAARGRGRRNVGTPERVHMALLMVVLREAQQDARRSRTSMTPDSSARRLRGGVHVWEGSEDG